MSVCLNTFFIMLSWFSEALSARNGFFRKFYVDLCGTYFFWTMIWSRFLSASKRYTSRSRIPPQDAWPPLKEAYHFGVVLKFISVDLKNYVFINKTFVYSEIKIYKFYYYFGNRYTVQKHWGFKYVWAHQTHAPDIDFWEFLF